MIEFHFFGMPIKTLGSLGKIRVGRVTRNTHIFFLPNQMELQELTVSTILKQLPLSGYFYYCQVTFNRIQVQLIYVSTVLLFYIVICVVSAIY